jgi:sialic acid synthase SpsE
MTKKTFIIAGAGINHNGDIGLGKQLIEAAKECGCDAIKFRTYKTDKIVDTSSPFYNTLKRCELDYDQQTELKIHADKTGIEFFSNPSDEEALFFLIDMLGNRRIKLTSFQITDTKLLGIVNEYAQNLPALKVILSTGMSTFKEVDAALKHLRNVSNITLSHCVSAYPTPDDSANLWMVSNFKYLVKNVGYSDHTSDILVPSLAVLAGATTIEKHFTMDLKNGAPDNNVSADPEMMSQLVQIIRLHERIMGDEKLGVKSIEQAAYASKIYS